MNRALKWIGIVLGGLILVVVIGGVVLHGVGRGRLNSAPAVAGRPVDIPTSAEAVARGEHLVDAVNACRECHGENLGGTVFMTADEGLGISLAAPNLTRGRGGVGESNTAADWEMALRHGVGSDGRALIFMPSIAYAHLSDEDLGAIIAYLQTVPAVDSAWDARTIGFPGSLIFGVLAYNDVAQVAMVDHTAVGQNPAPPAGATAEYGAYLAQIAGCSDCHAPNLAGVVGTDGPPPGPNLTPGGDLGGWSEADFTAALRTGLTPAGTTLKADMPWAFYSQMTDMEIEALWTYLHNLPPLPDNAQ